MTHSFGLKFFPPENGLYSLYFSLNQETSKTIAENPRHPQHPFASQENWKTKQPNPFFPLAWESFDIVCRTLWSFFLDGNKNKWNAPLRSKAWTRLTLPTYTHLCIFLLSGVIYGIGYRYLVWVCILCWIHVVLMWYWGHNKIFIFLNTLIWFSRVKWCI